MGEVCTLGSCFLLSPFPDGVIDSWQHTPHGALMQDDMTKTTKRNGTTKTQGDGCGAARQGVVGEMEVLCFCATGARLHTWAPRFYFQKGKLHIIPSRIDIRPSLLFKV